MGNLHLECKYNYCIYWVSSIWVLISDLILSNWRTWCKVNSLQTLEHRSFVVFLKKQIFFCRLPTTFFWLTSSPLIKDLRQFSICFYNQKGGKKHTISLYFFLNFRGISWMTHTHTQPWFDLLQRGKCLWKMRSYISFNPWSSKRKRKILISTICPAIEKTPVVKLQSCCLHCSQKTVN